MFRKNFNSLITVQVILVGTFTECDNYPPDVSLNLRAFQFYEMLAGTLTGLQADNRCKVLGALSIVKLLKLELALMKAVKEGSEIYLFIEMKCTLAMFLTYVTGWILKEIVEI